MMYDDTTDNSAATYIVFLLSMTAAVVLCPKYELIAITAISTLVMIIITYNLVTFYKRRSVSRTSIEVIGLPALVGFLSYYANLMFGVGGVLVLGAMWVGVIFLSQRGWKKSK